jgi:hypothetical protein
MVSARREERREPAVVKSRAIHRQDDADRYDRGLVLGPIGGTHRSAVQGIELAMGSNVAPATTAAERQRLVV